MSQPATDTPAPPVPEELELTVVIVNYNVRYFLEQCLRSVLAATADLRAEVIVVDNASTDSSAELAERFPEIRYLANADNLGFAKANNRGIRLARGRYILLLNPDTLVPEDAFARCRDYMDAHPDVGNLGVRMIDGRGDYLPESKRGFPGAWVSFTKMSGLAKLAPHSARLNGYYLGHLGERDTNTVDVLPGAFMWLRREALAAAGGGLDETYFMYGEDVDLSYTITQAGYRNVYFPEVTILHYKGESTRKRSWRYVRSFYEAMAIFSDKHVTRGRAGLKRALLRGAIYARATVALLVNALVAAFPFLLDALLVVLALTGVKFAWATYYFGVEDYYTQAFDTVNVPLYSGLWMLSLVLFRAYDRPLRIQNALRGIGFGTLFVLVAYALLPVEFRSSRAIILLTGSLAALLLVLMRVLWAQVSPSEVSFTEEKLGQDRRLVILGSVAEEQRCLALLGQAGIGRDYVGRISPAGEDARLAVASRDDLASALVDLTLDELIVCTRDETYASAIALIETYGRDVEVRTLAEGAAAIVGSPSPDTPGQTYSLARPFAIEQPLARRRKRSLDVALALALLLVFPLSLAAKHAGGALRNAFWVLLGRATWVGYAPAAPKVGLPVLPPSVLHPSGQSAGRNERYARHYSVRSDLRLLRKHFRDLGRSPTTAHVQPGTPPTMTPAPRH